MRSYLLSIRMPFLSKFVPLLFIVSLKVSAKYEFVLFLYIFLHFCDNIVLIIYMGAIVMKSYFITLMKKLTFLICSAMCVIFIIESLNRGLSQTISFIYHSPFIFLVNASIVLLFSLPALFCKRFLISALLWELPFIALGIVNYFLRLIKGTPFVVADFTSASAGISLLTRYLTVGFVCQVVCFIVIVLIVIYTVFKISKQSHCLPKRFTLAFVVCISSLIYSIQVLSYYQEEANDTYLANRSFVYDTYGFIDTFAEDVVASVFDVPLSPAMNAAVFGDLTTTSYYLFDDTPFHFPTDTPTDPIETIPSSFIRKPNILFVQLESAFDPYLLGESLYVQDPIPRIRAASDTGYSGILYVPTFAGGTPRSEFEVLTGMSLAFITEGVPYSDGTVSHEPFETIASILHEQDYATTAIHNHYGHFFNRNEVYSLLGFDTFISRENIYPAPLYNGWVDDTVLIDTMLDTLTYTPETDFIFTVSAGLHGPYTDEEVTTPSFVIPDTLDEEVYYQLENYMARLHHLDTIVGTLIDRVMALEEPTILVMYSDHGPNLEALREWDTSQKYQTFYTIIDNQGYLPQHQNVALPAYQLHAVLFDLLGNPSGQMHTFHHTHSHTDTYLEALKSFQSTAFTSPNTSLITPLQIGLKPVVIDSIAPARSMLSIRGEQFTTSSRVTCNDMPLTTYFISPQELIVACPPKDTLANTYQVVQVGLDDKVISSSNTFTYVLP